MARSTNVNVASPLGPSMEELEARMNQNLGYQPAPAQDPRETVQGLVDSIPAMRPMPLAEGVAFGDQQINSMQDVADISGSEWANAPLQPEVDEAGNLIIDPETNQPVMRQLVSDDYNTQLDMERNSVRDLRGAIKTITGGQDPYADTTEGLSQAWGSAYRAKFGDSTQLAQTKMNRDYDKVEHYIDKSSTPTAQRMNETTRALFGPDSIKTEVDGYKVSVGLKVLHDNGLADDPSAAKALGLIGGLALSQAGYQMGVRKEDYQAPAPKDEDGGTLDSHEYMSNTIEATAHFMNNGLRNADIKLKPGSADTLAKALVYDAVREGRFLPYNDPETGRPVLIEDPESKNVSRLLQKNAEVFLGESAAAVASSTPNHNGNNLLAGKPRLTKGAIVSKGFIARAANAAKNVFGSTGLIYRKKDVARKSKELQAVLSKMELDSSGRPVYSSHPWAKRVSLSKSNYEVAYMSASLPTDNSYDPSNPEHVQMYQMMQADHAAEVMGKRMAMLEYNLAMVQNTVGVKYGQYSHSPANQRFYPVSSNVNYMADKDVVRDTLGLANQNVVKPSQLFDPRMSDYLRDKGSSILMKKGRAQHKAWTELSDSELGAIGAMYSAVIYYYTALDQSINNITKMPIHKAILLYNQSIANRLAEIGAKYNAWLEGGEMDPELEDMYTAMDRGEATGTANLWDDFFQAQKLMKDPVRKQIGIGLTHQVFDDGNQNGIFLQAIYFGSTGDAAIRLATANPNLADMRVHTMNTMVQELETQLKDNELADAAWRNFWKAAIELNGKDEVAKDFLKMPLMQTSYSKDASMFGSELMNLLDANEDYIPLAQKYLLPAYDGKLALAAASLNEAVTNALRQAVDSMSGRNMQAIARYLAVIGSPLMLESISGDTSIFTPPGLTIVNHNVGGESYYKQEVDGREVLIKKLNKGGETLFNPKTGGSVTLPDVTRELRPDASKGTTHHLDRTTMKYNAFHNPLGMGQSRAFAVLPIQSVDGDLVKWTTLFVNKGRKIPAPALWVHDSIISTAGYGMIYRNAYNNIAIPDAIPEIAKMGKKIDQAMREGERTVLDRVQRKKDPVGIGSEGEFGAMGALFDDFHNRLDPNGEYKKIRLARWEKQAESKLGKPVKVKSFNKIQKPTEPKAYAKMKWDEYVSRVNGVLKQAKELGWVPPMSGMPENVRKYVAVTPANFAKLADLSAQFLNLKGPTQGPFRDWIDGWESRTLKTGERLLEASKFGGIHQMSIGAMKPVKKSVKPSVAELQNPTTAIPPMNDPFLDKDNPFTNDMSVSFKK
jgi:hypothetical protein